MGRSRRAQARARGLAGELRGAVPSLRRAELPVALARSGRSRQRVATSQARARDWRHLPARKRAPQSLFLRALAGTVRRAVARRRDTRARAARTQRRMAARGSPRDVSNRRVMDRFDDRRHAGRLLGAALERHVEADASLLVLALPRGGVPVGYEVACTLHAALDVFIVRKLGVPGQRELAMGAIATGNVVVLN